MKTKATGQSAHRNQQFENIERKSAGVSGSRLSSYQHGYKKRELIGELYRDGRLYTQEPIEVFDHDWVSRFAGSGNSTRIMGLDSQHRLHPALARLMTPVKSACDSIRYWWSTYGKSLYPHAPEILLLCDGGGSNNSRHYVFKQDLQALANQLGVAIRVAHYPPYTSKYNPIEHRLFPHVTRACLRSNF